MSRRVGTYREPAPDKSRHTVSDPFLRQLVQGNCNAKLRKLHSQLETNAEEVELELLKRSKALPESMAALLQAFDAGASFCRVSDTCLQSPTSPASTSTRQRLALYATRANQR